MVSAAPLFLRALVPLFLAILVTICKVEKYVKVKCAALTAAATAAATTSLLLCLFGKWSSVFYLFSVFFSVFFFLGYVSCPSGQLLLVTLSSRPKICLSFPWLPSPFPMFVVVVAVFCLFHAQSQPQPQHSSAPSASNPLLLICLLPISTLFGLLLPCGN